jgi:hypothetical protein
MKNLAGHPEADHFIRSELVQAGLEIVEYAENIPRSEVPTRITGRMGPFKFTRLWYYWVVDGPVPLRVAEEMYADPVGATDVRVAGHCGCPPPKEWATYLDSDGFVVIEDPDGSEERSANAFFEQRPGLKCASAERYVRNLADVKAEAFVENYHIDTQAGLNLFVETLRRNGLDRGSR